MKSGETAKEVGISHEATKVRTSVDVHQFSGKIQNPPTRMKMDDTRTSHQEPLLRSSLKKRREAPSSSREITGDISRISCNLLRQQLTPDNNIPVFKGNPLEYHYFMSPFKVAVECKIDDFHGRLVRLLKFTDGEAKETIQHCIEQSPEVGYRLAKTLLEEHYGNSHRILVAYHKESKSCASLKQGDSSAYRKFYNFLIKCESIMSRQQWNALDTPDVLCSLISKLPGNARDRWNRRELNLRRHEQREPELANLIEFVEKEVVLVNDPLFSKEVLKECTDKNEKVNKKRRTKTYVTKTSEQAKERNDGSKLIECQICGDGHDADYCSIFNGQTVEERRKTLARKKLRHGCYTQITADHNARTCKTQRTCRICNQKHRTGLHGYISKKKGINIKNGGDSTKGNDGGDGNTLLQSNFAEVDVKCASNCFLANIISMCVVPVKLSHATTKKEVSTLAMLDNCS